VISLSEGEDGDQEGMYALEGTDLYTLHDLMQRHAFKPPQANEMIDFFHEDAPVVDLGAFSSPEFVRYDLG
jgi:hypothetical protein